MWTLRELVEEFHCRLIPVVSYPPDHIEWSLNSLEWAAERDLSYFSSPRYFSFLEKTRAGLLVTKESFLPEVSERYKGPILLHDNPESLVVDLLHILQNRTRAEEEKSRVHIHPTAVVHPTAVIHPTASIGPFVTIEASVQIEEYCVLNSHVSVGAHSRVGSYTRIEAGAMILSGSIIEKHCIIGANAVIGSNGFGFLKPAQSNKPIPQLGGVWLEEHVEIGALTVIDRSTFPGSYTRIGKHTKIDNLVQVAHNVQIGAYCAISAQSGFAGSSRLGDRVICGGQVGVRDGCHVESNSILLGRTAVTKNLPSGIYIGFPAEPHLSYKRRAMKLRMIIDRYMEDK